MKQIIKHLGCLAVAGMPLFLAGCSTSLDRTDDLRKLSSAPQVRGKSDVVDAVGLPIVVEHDPATGNEIWYYTGKASSSSTNLSTPNLRFVVGGSSQFGVMNDSALKDRIDGNPVTLVCVFGPDGSLVQLKQPVRDKQ